MAFYVPVGPRGLIFRLGTALIGVMGSITYWRACRRRPEHLPTIHLALDLPEA